MVTNSYLRRISSFFLILGLLVSVNGAYSAVDAGERETSFERHGGTAESSGSYRIGCVLPLTGRYAAVGNRALEAVMLATGVFDPAIRSPIELVIEDSRSTPDAAVAAVAKLATQDRVLCILGPLGGNEVLDAVREAQRLEVPILILTQKESITDVGDYVFRDFLTNLMQIKALVRYAVVDMGLKRFAVLYPDDQYGREMEKLFRDEVINLGGEIQKVKSYEKSQTDFGDEIMAIVRMKKPSTIGRKHEGKSAYETVDFDALFIPDTSLQVNMIAPQLAFYNVRGITLLGTSGWNSPDLPKISYEHLEGAVFVDGFSLDSFYPEVQDFVDIFYMNYGREPDTLDALVFDSAAIAAKVIKENRVETREQFRDALLSLKDYSGVTGRTSFSGTREARKDVFILTIKDGRIRQVR